MEKILTIFTIASSGYVISEFIISLFKKLPPKPFSCGYCLSFWIALLINLPKIMSEPIEVFMLACASAVLNAIIFKWIN